ncbi:M20/M25/M40 family metallo-hydrolase [Nocardia sp. NPDC004151]|uniref:M20/M25/M40 family metallo-hydrolase n=1 Tax=Nocardia sp. NPDC004151 TaxID=3364304 RepID=UPI00369672F6
MTSTAPTHAPTVDDATAERLAGALRCRTVSHEDHSRIDPAEFERLAGHLEKCFPLVHAHLTWESFGHSRLYRWAGSAATEHRAGTAGPEAKAAAAGAAGSARQGTYAGEPGAEAVAAILLAHMDVVPVDDHDGWPYPPFGGVVDDEFIWGRGAIDDKSRMIAILEAVEAALRDGVAPTQTVYLAFGHDEEIFGADGAGRMSRRLRDAGVRARLLVDEGGVITVGVAEGIDVPVATIMVGEKGFATVRLSVTDVGGHSSMPGRQTAVGRLARAVARIQDHPFPLRLTPVAVDMLTRVRKFVTEPRRTLLGLVNVAGPIAARVLAARPQTEALVRTTTAPTVISGGVKSNVLPQRAEAYVNFRILPGDSVAGVLAHCRKVVRDNGVTIELDGTCSEPSADPSAGPDFDVVADVARAVVPGLAVTVGVVPAATDSRYYDDLARTRCNFAPIMLSAADLERIHGTGERISRANYARLIRFNRLLIDRIAAF